MIIQAATYVTALRQRIEQEFAGRNATYQQTKSAGNLQLLACGDSWFDYPLDGSLFTAPTDVLAQLPAALGGGVDILSLAHYGYTSTRELGLAKQQQLTNAIRGNGAFNAILLSAGGNDVVGDSLVVWLNDADDVRHQPALALNEGRFEAVLACVKAAYLDLIALRDDLLPKAPIFAHSYDFPPVTGVGVCLQGPWLKPALDFCGWSDGVSQALIIEDLMKRFAAMLDVLAAQPENRFVHVQTQGTLTAAEWANELHPTPAGFKKIAAKFAAALHGL